MTCGQMADGPYTAAERKGEKTGTVEISALVDGLVATLDGWFEE